MGNLGGTVTGHSKQDLCLESLSILSSFYLNREKKIDLFFFQDDLLKQ